MAASLVERNLEIAYEMRLPSALIQLYELALDSGIDLHDDFYSTYGFYSQASADDLIAETIAEVPSLGIYLWQASVPEFVQFGTGAGGEGYGLLVRAPEIDADEYQIGLFNPSSSEQIFFLGGDLKTALEDCLYGMNQVRMAVGDMEREPNEDRVLSIARQTFGLVAPHKNARRHPIPDPPCPEGYEFKRSRDGIGVLASADAFGPEEAAFVPYALAVTSGAEATALLPSVLEDCERWCERGFPATALLGLRRTHFSTSGLYDRTMSMRVFELMARAYDDLDRPFLAHRARIMSVLVTGVDQGQRKRVNERRLLATVDSQRKEAYRRLFDSWNQG